MLLVFRWPTGRFRRRKKSDGSRSVSMPTRSPKWKFVRRLFRSKSVQTLDRCPAGAITAEAMVLATEDSHHQPSGELHLLSCQPVSLFFVCFFSFFAVVYIWHLQSKHDDPYLFSSVAVRRVFQHTALAESARILAGGTARSATSSPTQSGPCTYRGAVIQEEEDEITLDIPTVATASIHNGVVLDMHKETLESLDLQHNGQQKGRAEITAPLASVEDVTDSVVAVAPVATASRQPSRDNPLLIRLRQWTDRFGLNPVRSASAEPPENGAADVPKSPKLLGSRKIVSNSLSRLFSRSSSHKAAQQQQSMANSVASPESNYLPMPASSAGSRRRSKTIINATEMSRSLDDVTAAHMITDSTNHPSQKRLD